jgi:flagellar basal-body rod protein FlgF
MERGLYIAAAGMIAEQIRQDAISNDLANASTNGYKPDIALQSSFQDMLLQNDTNGQQVGTLSQGPRISRLVTDFTQGPLRNTGNQLDLALAGDGFFEVSTPGGVRYTRNGQLLTDAQGRLMTSTGLELLGVNGKPISVGTTAPSTVAIDPEGDVRVSGKLVGTIAVVSLTAPAKQGDTLYTGRPGSKPAGTSVQQGYLEGSGVDAARAMVDMIASLRAYESTQRVIHALDEALGKATTSVGSASG